MNPPSGSPLREVVRVDLDALDIRSAAVSIAGLTVVLAIVSAVGEAAIAGAVAALFVATAVSGGLARSPTDGALFVAIGTGVTLAVGLAAISTWAVSIVIGMVAFATTLAARHGPGAAASGSLLLIWAVTALSIERSDREPLELAGAFAFGGAVTFGMLWLAHRTRPTIHHETAPSDIDQRAVMSASMVRAVGAATCVALGAWWFPAHESWVALTFVLVLRPPQQHVIVAGVGRTLGTVAGVVIGMSIAALMGDNHVSLIIAFAICAFGMVAACNVNYAVFTTFLTALLLLSQRLIEGDAFSTGIERLGATAVGVALAFIGITALRRATGPGSDA